MKTLMIALTTLVLTGVCAAEKEANMNMTTQVIGTWSCEAATINGNPLADATVKKLRLTMTDTRYKTQRNEEVLFDSTYRLDTTKSPAHISMVGTEGDLAGKEAQGIIVVEGDTLKICYTMPGQPRPTAFASPANSGAYLIVWKRDKK